MSAPPTQAQAQALNAASVAAMKAGRFAEAQALIDQALALDRRQLAIWLNQAALHRALGQPDRAMASVDEALRLEPRSFRALLVRASLMERLQGALAAGPLYGQALRQLPPETSLDAATLKAVAHAREVNQAYARELEAALRRTLPGADSPDRRRMERFVEHLTGRRKIYRQEPVGYFYPGQPAIEFWEREEFPWIEAFEACTPAIVAELAAWAAGSSERLIPYLDHPDTGPLDQWAELNNSLRWSALHLLNFGRRVEENCALFPQTLEALRLLPQPMTVNRSPSAMFSVLEPHTRIPPHTGISNTRLVVHLPLVVPGNCFFRVGNEVRPWRVGEAWVFDDTIEHEAWNDSDERRIILICDVWSPRLSEGERTMIADLMAAMDTLTGEPAARPDSAL